MDIGLEYQRQQPLTFYKHGGMAFSFVKLKGRSFMCLKSAGQVSVTVSCVIARKKRMTGICTFAAVNSEYCFCRPGMPADFTVLQHNLLHSLAGDASLLPEVTGTFVDGKCVFGCANFASAPEVAAATAARQSSAM